ncbi:MAG: hypothetical protein H6Q04_1803 [Acidobacteria bacterium]|nr:hypothetical protein [Acidobacteriota bacterium]
MAASRAQPGTAGGVPNGLVLPLVTGGKIRAGMEVDGALA